MSRFDELKKSVDQVITLTSSSLAELASAEKEIERIQQTKEGLEIDIKELKDGLAMLKSTKQDIEAKYKERDSEVAKIKAQALSQLDDIEKERKRIAQASLDNDNYRAELEAKEALLKQKQQQALDRYNESIARIKEADEKLDKAENLIKNSGIEDRELKVASAQSKADKAMKDALNKDAQATVLWSSADELRAKTEKFASEIEIIKKKQATKESELQSLEAVLNSRQVELDKREKDVKYQELRVNKIIKEKNIADLLGGG